MSVKRITGGISVSDVEKKLPATFFIMRGHIRTAFGLSKTEVERLITKGVFVAKYPLGARTRARFVRSQILAAARKLEGAT